MSFHRLAYLLTAAVLMTAGCESGGDPVNVGPEPDRDPRIRLMSQIPLASGGVVHSDVWGYVDAATGKEYALVGAYGGKGLFIVDVSDPAAPIHVATVNVPGFDMKVWGHYAYSVTGGGDRGGSFEGRIVDLRTPEEPVVVGTFPSSHNLFIDDQGYMYLEAPGLRILNLNPDPTNPTPVWTLSTTGGHDASVIGNRLYDFHGVEGTFIYDVTSREDPRLLGAITAPSIRYHHSGWTSKDGRYLFICDELSQNTSADVTVWDIQDPADPVLVAEIGDDDATVHNLYIIDKLAYVSYYTAGFRVYDVSDPTQPRLVDEYDAAPNQTGQGFRGTWGVYPFTPSGNLYVSDIDNGLYVFALE